MATNGKKLSLAEILILIALVAVLLGLWRQYGGEWTYEENRLGACWLTAFLVGYLGGRGVAVRAMISCGTLCALACGGCMAWLGKPWQVSVIVGAAAGLLATIAAIIPGSITSLLQGLHAPAARRRIGTFALIVLPIVVLTGVGIVLYRYAQPGPARPLRIWQLHNSSTRGNSPLRCSYDARFIATGHYEAIDSVSVFDTWWGKKYNVTLPKNEWRFSDLSPSGNLVAITSPYEGEAVVVVNRLNGKSLSLFGENRSWASFVDEEHVRLESKSINGEHQLWDISTDPPRQIEPISPNEVLRPEPPEIKYEWLSGFSVVNWYGNKSHSWVGNEKNREPQRNVKFVGIGDDEKTIVFCEWAVTSPPPQQFPAWTGSLPFVQTTASDFLRVNLAVIDANRPERVYRSAYVKMDYVQGRYDSIVFSTFISPDRKTIIVYDGHYNIALWRVDDLRLGRDKAVIRVADKPRFSVMIS